MLTRRRIAQSPEDNPITAADRQFSAPSKWAGSTPDGFASASSPVINGSRPQLSCFPPNATKSSSQDRTQEYLSVIKSTQIRQNFGIIPSAPRRTTSRNEFTIISNKIGKDISSTLAKLEKLTLLTAKRSRDSVTSQEMEQLTRVIRQDLSMLNKQIAGLQQLLNSAGSHSSRHGQMHANTVTVTLQSKLVTISTEFKAVLEQRNSELKAESFQDGRSSHSKPGEFQHDAGNDYTGSQVVINMGEGSQLYQRQQQVTRQQAAQRSETMNSVEQTIVELGGIFQQFAHMVKEQEELIQRIDSHVDESHLNIDVAHSEIVKYFHAVSSNRSLMIKIFVLLIIFFTVFVYIIR